LTDSGTNPPGENFEAYNQRRWGSSGWTNHLKQEGREDGAMFEKLKLVAKHYEKTLNDQICTRKVWY
jgi:hypothetical protein